MADVQTQSTKLSLLAGFVDEDDRTISLQNPVANITESQIRALESAAAPVLIGDKYGAAFSRFKSAKYINATQIKYDLG